MGNKSRKPSEKLVGQKWKKGQGRRDTSRATMTSGWRGLQPENVSKVGSDIDQVIGRFRKVPRPPLKAK